MFFMIFYQEEKKGMKMKLKSLVFKELLPNGWEIGPISFQDLNLLVGGSGAGKSRTMNSIFNLARFIASNILLKVPLECKIIFGDDLFTYEWEIKTQKKEETADLCNVVKERLSKTDNDSGEKLILIFRNEDKNEFSGTILPKLDLYSSLIYILREEEQIKPVFLLFKHIVKRNFFDNSLSEGMAYQNIPAPIEKEFSETKNVYTLLTKNTTINGILYLLKQHDEQKYNAIINSFKDIFENILECGVDFSQELMINIPNSEPMVSFWIKEKNVDRQIFSQEMSSGMQKVLMILTDLIALPKDIIYLVDEYENSLGVNAIDFLPSLLNEYANDRQILITTHHPYLINKIPIANWLLINRHGSKVTAIPGKTLSESYGNSRQDSFIKLVNDPRYTMGAI